MKRTVLVLIFSVNLLSAQKVVRKTMLNPEIKAIAIDGINCFKINMKTSNSDELEVRAKIEGEYKKNLILNLREEGSNLFVNAGFSPNFKDPNDKLSAHKVVSISLDIGLPESQRVQVNGLSCNVFVTGNYEQLKITLNDGNCSLNNVSEKVFVVTQSGDINLRSKRGKIKSVSKFGKIEDNDIPIGTDYYSLKTTTGNIGLMRID